MSQWQVQQAKARFSELLDTCLEHGPQIVTKHGIETAVLVPIDQWRRMQSDHPTLKQLLLAPEPRCELPVPSRGPHRLRRAGAGPVPTGVIEVAGRLPRRLTCGFSIGARSWTAFRSRTY
jgi:prevent-host-death family protein